MALIATTVAPNTTAMRPRGIQIRLKTLIVTLSPVVRFSCGRDVCWTPLLLTITALCKFCSCDSAKL